MDVSREELVRTVLKCRPHLVIIGAGASRAALPAGDYNGKQLPVMNDFIDVLELRPLLNDIDFRASSNNFEEIYSEISLREELATVREELEKRVYDYFSALQLPYEANIYDYLMLALREKDVIATFNWDPFLIQAQLRNHQAGFPMPGLRFLHGNVTIGYCERDRTSGLNGRSCSKCGAVFTPSRLLYPVAQKDYRYSPYIEAEWEELQSDLSAALRCTIFGYGAPNSDAAAIDLLKQGWGPSVKRNMEEIELIDIRPEHELEETWADFIHSHHCSFASDYFNSSFAIFPRRTIEADKLRLWDARFVENNPVIRTPHLAELWDWHRELLQAEELSE